MIVFDFWIGTESDVNVVTNIVETDTPVKTKLVIVEDAGTIKKMRENHILDIEGPAGTGKIIERQTLHQELTIGVIVVAEKRIGTEAEVLTEESHLRPLLIDDPNDQERVTKNRKIREMNGSQETRGREETKEDQRKKLITTNEDILGEVKALVERMEKNKTRRLQIKNIKQMLDGKKRNKKHKKNKTDKMKKTMKKKEKKLEKEEEV